MHGLNAVPGGTRARDLRQIAGKIRKGRNHGAPALRQFDTFDRAALFAEEGIDPHAGKERHVAVHIDRHFTRFNVVGATRAARSDFRRGESGR